MTKQLSVAYFTMEIGLQADIPTFAGGLGVLAADLMRSAADLKVDAACVTMCWKFGYLHQTLRGDGTQKYEDLTWDPEKKLKLLPQRIQVEIEKRMVTVAARVLELKSGKHVVPVLFLDTNLPENSQEDRDICKHLYGGDGAMRIKQEIVLGMGGVKMLRALGYDHIKNFHMNEGHCAFLTLELLKERGFKDDEVRKSCAFTTHTPVAAGHDVFNYDLAWKIAGDNLPWHIKKLAGEDALSMTKLAMNLSRYTCGVSRVHGQVSQKLLNNPHVDSITNGVHHREWCSPQMKKLFDARIPGWEDDPSLLTKHCRELTDEDLWKSHMEAKNKLLKIVNEGRDGEEMFDPNCLTIASARRVVPYKRPELLYTNMERLREIGCGRLQIIHAGNAHPHDPFSQDVIRRMIERSKELKGCVKIAYLPNYNPDLAKLLVSGADVWLNTPMRLHEASGTSGMKAALNGVVNLSTLDGWWIEGYERDPESGWRIGPKASSLDADDTRKIDAEDLYTQLQYEVIPEYYYEGRVRWLRRMKRAIGLMGYFNTFSQDLRSTPITLSQSSEAQVYGLFAVAMALTAVGVVIGAQYAVQLFSTGMHMFLLIAELAIIFTSRFWMDKSPLNYLLFGAFPILSGITITPFLLYVQSEFVNGNAILLNAFASTAFMAAAAAVFARTTRWNLGVMGRALFFALIGLLIFGVLQLFIPALRGSQFEMLLSGAGVVIFALFTAFDIQRIQQMSKLGANPFMMALSLYLDIYNLFLYVVRFMLAISGSRRN